MGDASLSRLRNKEERSLYMGGRETTSTGEGEQVDTVRKERRTHRGEKPQETSHRQLDKHKIKTKVEQTELPPGPYKHTHTNTHSPANIAAEPPDHQTDWQGDGLIKGVNSVLSSTSRTQPNHRGWADYQKNIFAKAIRRIMSWRMPAAHTDGSKHIHTGSNKQYGKHSSNTRIHMS